MKKAKRKAKTKKIMREWKSGKLHSGSKRGPVVKNQKQAVAIMLNETSQSKRRKRRAKSG